MIFKVTDLKGLVSDKMYHSIASFLYNNATCEYTKQVVKPSGRRTQNGYIKFDIRIFTNFYSSEQVVKDIQAYRPKIKQKLRRKALEWLENYLMEIEKAS